MEEKEQIKRSVSITDVVSLYVDLRPAGKNLKALCPFHTEKTPSFYVMPEKDSFACYGCNKFGDIFTFIQEMENLSFPDAMNFLVDKFNIPVDRKAGGRSVKKDIYTRITEVALKYFRANLYDSPEGKKALRYLEERGIKPNTIDRFKLGYAINRWDGLYNHLKRESVDTAKSIELGLLIKKDSQRVYDRFRGRIIFPIFSESGAPIAFGGRTIFDEANKYLNSPDTPLYKKSKHLYGFNLTKNAIREAKCSVLVEGYFDVVSMVQHGVENVAASLGTALTESQIYLLKRFSDKIYIFYDSDSAGITAAVRGIEKMFEQNINPGIITLAGTETETKDPDDFIREYGVQGFNRLLESATGGFRFLIDNIARKYDLKVPERKNEAVRKIMEFVKKFSDPFIENDFTEMVENYFKVDGEELRKILRDRRGNKDSHRLEKKLEITPAEHDFLKSLLVLPELIAEIEELVTEDILSVLASKNIVRSLLKHFNPGPGNIDIRAISETLNESERVLFREIYEQAATADVDRKLLEELVETSFLQFQEMVNKRRARWISREIRIAEGQNDRETLLKLCEDKLNKKQQKYRKKQHSTTGGTVDRN
jgi:DNA primase